jgi:hypothetical protein
MTLKIEREVIRLREATKKLVELLGKEKEPKAMALRTYFLALQDTVEVIAEEASRAGDPRRWAHD